ncbi:MAG TPA: hypothetical protein PLV42_07020 [bacterium]|nr:hypothetical protein [bacterium]
MKNVLHIYGPACWHDEIVIVGDLDGLLTLKKAVDRALMVAIVPDRDRAQALRTEPPYPFDINHKDGEGSSLYIAVATPEQMDKFPLPYTDEPANLSNEPEQYQDLYEHCIPGYKRHETLTQKDKPVQ